MSKYKVLIAEDDRDIINVLTLYLNNAGYDVEAAFDGFEALNLLECSDFDMGADDYNNRKWL